VLDLEGDALVVHDSDLESPAWYCLQPQYHEPGRGRELMDLVVSHGDRSRSRKLRHWPTRSVAWSAWQ
jgi:hypothetical protein